MTEERWMYLSFARNGWRGACIVRGGNVVEAAAEAHRRGCNPGGEVLGLPVDPVLLAKTPEEFRNVLLTEADVAALPAPDGEEQGVATVVMTEKGLERVDDDAS